MTQFQLDKMKQVDMKEAAAMADARAKEQRREVGEEAYEMLVGVRHENAVDGVDARDVDTALAQMGLQDECASPPISHNNAPLAPRE